MNLKTKMTLAISLLTAALLSVLAFVAQHYFVDEMKQLAYGQQFCMISALADQLDDKITTTQTELTTTAGTLTSETIHDRARVAAFFATRPDTLAMFDNGLLLFSPQGKLLALNPRAPELLARDFSREPYFRKTLSSRAPQISEPFLSPQAHRHPIVMFTAPVFSQDGHIIAILGGSIDLSENNFLGKLASVKVGEHGYLYLFNGQGVLISHPTRERIGKPTAAPGANLLYDRALHGFEGAGETVNSQHTAMISSFKRLRTTRWILASNYPVAEAYRPVHRAQHLLMVSLSCVFLLSVIAVWLFTRQLTAPLISITSQIRRLRQSDDCQKRIRVEGSDEIGLLGEAFNQLLEELELQKAELKGQLDFSQRMIDTMPIPVYYKGIEGRYLGCNRAFEEFTGSSKGEIIGKTAFEISPRYLADEYHRTDLDLMQKKGVQVYETRYSDVDGKLRNVIFFKTSFPAADGTPAGIIGAMLDITELKQAQEAHQKINRQLQLILDAAGDGIYGLDLEGRITFVNPAAAALTGSYVEELLGREQHAIMHHGEEGEGSPHPVGQCPLYETLRGGESHHGLEQFRRKDGSSFPVEFVSTPIREEGAVVGAVVIFKDITERNQVEEQLLKLSQAVIQSPISIIITDTAGNVEFVNPKFTEVSGYAPEEIVGKNPRMLKSGKTPPEVYRNLWSTISSGQVWSGEIHNRQKGGDTYWEQTTISPITNSAGVICHYMAFKEDMTERKRLEEQLRQAQKMEAIGQLAGGVAHDFNNILTVVLGFGQLLQSSFADEDPNRGHIDQILDAADRATHLTRSLLAFSRKQVMLLQQIELNDLTRKLTKFLVRIIGEDIALKTSFCEEPLPVLADSGQIEQVLMNLATNARDAMPTGGELEIRITPVQLGKEFHQQHGYGEPGRYALITFSDTGAGMSPQTQQKIFEPFFTTKAPGHGTGLGLSIVYGIVKQHGGYINVASKRGVGTTFTIYLPLKTQQQDGEERQSFPPRGGNETILVVEDDPAVGRLVESLLQRYGYRVILADNGDTAIDIFQSKWQDIDLALLDVIMPKMNGREVCELLRKRSPRLKVLFLSGYTSDVIQDKGIAVDGIDIIMKPAKPLDLARKVRELLDTAA